MDVFSVGLFLLLCFLPREVPLTFVVKLVCWCWILLTFACLKAFDLSIKSEGESCGVEYSWLRFFPFITLNISCHSLLACRVSNQQIAWWEFSYMLFDIFPLLLLMFYLWSLIFVSLIAMCLDVLLPGFILPGILCASWTWLTISFPMFGKLLAIISSNIFSGPFSTPYGSPIMQMLVCLMFQISLRLSSLLFIHFFLYYFLWQWFLPFCPKGHLLLYLIILLLVPSSVLFISLSLFFSSCRSLVNISYIFSIFASVLFPNPRSSSLSFWIIFLEDCHFI